MHNAWNGKSDGGGSMMEAEVCTLISTWLMIYFQALIRTNFGVASERLGTDRALTVSSELL